MLKRSIKLLAVIVGLGLLAASCGSSGSDDAVASGTTASSGATPATTYQDDSSFGDDPWPCSSGTASGNTAQGVTDEKIIIGGGDDRGFPTSPGLNKEQTDAVAAFVKECNRRGGINGREIEHRVYDAAILNVAQIMTEACDQVFMLVGSGFSLDGAAEATRVDCDLGAVPAWAVSADFAHGPKQITAVPNPSDEQTLSQASIIANVVAQNENKDITKSAAYYADYAATEETWEKIKATWPTTYDYEFTTVRSYSIFGEEDWAPWSRAILNDDVEHVNFVGSCLPNYLALRSQGLIDNLDPSIIWTTEANFYETRCANANTDGAMNNTFVRLVFTPFEEAQYNKATQQFIDIVEDDGSETTLLGMQAVSSFLLWAQAAKACGSNLTQDCVLEELGQVNSWTGHGLHTETDPAGNRAARCGMIVKLENTEYVRVYPEEPATFACNEDFDEPDWRAIANTPAVEAAQLDANRLSTKFTG